jgi:hypothetical protein
MTMIGGNGLIRMGGLGWKTDETPDMRFLGSRKAMLATLRRFGATDLGEVGYRMILVPLQSHQ